MINKIYIQNIKAVDLSLDYKIGRIMKNNVKKLEIKWFKNFKIKD